jgi:CrcB protein
LDPLPIDPDLAPATSRRVQPSILAAIALGGALGAPARYGVAQLLPVAPDHFPWATFWTNVSGSFALGLILALILERFPPTRYLRPFIATGFLGAYTTYSTFAVEVDLLVKDGHAGTAIAYSASSLVVGLVAVWIGLSVARAMKPRAGAVREP